jgi:hypothetical protein
MKLLTNAQDAGIKAITSKTNVCSMLDGFRNARALRRVNLLTSNVKMRQLNVIWPYACVIYKNKFLFVVGLMEHRY